jgi:hypothetical protein
MPFWFHTIMKNTDYLNCVICELAVIDDMAPARIAPVSFTNVAAIFAFKRLMGYRVKALIQLCQIFISLFLTPFLLGIAANSL